VFAVAGREYNLFAMYLPILLQLPDTSALDTLHKEWPAIRAAPYSFAICVFIVGVVLASVIYAFFRSRLQAHREQIGHLERDVERMKRELDSLKMTPPLATAPSSVSISDAGKATATIGDIHFHPPAPLPPQPSPTTIHPREKIVKIEHSEPILKSISLEDDNTLCIGNTQKQWLALLLPIYSDAEKSDAGVDAKYVRATLVFTESTTNKVVRVSHGTWIRATLDYVEMSPGEVQHLVVVVFKGDLTDASAINSNITSYDFYSYHNTEVAFDFEDLGLRTYGARIIVMWAGTTRGKEIFDLTLDLKQLAESAA